MAIAVVRDYLLPAHRLMSSAFFYILTPFLIVIMMGSASPIFHAPLLVLVPSRLAVLELILIFVPVIALIGLAPS